VRLSFNKEIGSTPKERRRLGMVMELATDLMRDELREKRSGTYGVAVFPEIELKPVPRVQVGVQFGCAPERVDELSQAALTILAGLADKPASPERLQQLKATARRAHEAQLRNNGYWLDWLAGSLLRGEEPRELLELGAEIDHVTAADLQQTAAKFLDLSHHVRVVLLPEASGASTEVRL